MILIVEGPDKAGKTTIVNALAREFDCHVFKQIKPPSWEALRQDIQELLGMEGRFENLKRHPKITILDRWYLPSDIVYSPVVEGKPSRLEPYMAILERRLQRIGVAYLYVTASPEVILQRYEKIGGDEYLPPHLVPEIIERYEDFFAFTTLPHFKLDTGNLNEKEAVDLAISITRRLIRLFRDIHRY